MSHTHTHTVSQTGTDGVKEDDKTAHNIFVKTKRKNISLLAIFVL